MNLPYQRKVAQVFIGSCYFDEVCSYAYISYISHPESIPSTATSFLLGHSTFLYCYLFKLIFGVMFAVPYLVTAIKSSTSYHYMLNEKM